MKKLLGRDNNTNPSAVRFARLMEYVVLIWEKTDASLITIPHIWASSTATSLTIEVLSFPVSEVRSIS